MNDFKEWLSDNLRYFLLAFIILLIIGAAILGISIYSKVVNGGGSWKEPVKQTESVKETEKQTEDTKASEMESEKQTEPKAQTEAQKETEALTEELTEPQTEAPAEPQTEAPTEPQTEAPTEPQTEAPTEPPTEPQPVYLTMQGSCYLRAEPSTESEILGTYWVGTTVEFLEDVGGWYKVRVDGMTGYMGARFF